MDELPARKVTLCDSYWSPRLEVNARRAIFHQWEQLEASGCIDNFRIAAGEKEGFREGWFFADSDAYKWLDAAARIYANPSRPEACSERGRGACRPICQKRPPTAISGGMLPNSHKKIQTGYRAQESHRTLENHCNVPARYIADFLRIICANSGA